MVRDIESKTRRWKELIFIGTRIGARWNYSEGLLGVFLQEFLNTGYSCSCSNSMFLQCSRIASLCSLWIQSVSGRIDIFQNTRNYFVNHVKLYTREEKLEAFIICVIASYGFAF